MPIDAQGVLNALVEQLKWYAPKILSLDEKEKWWFCHLARQNLIGSVFTPVFRRLVVGCLDECEARTFEAGDREKTLLCSFSTHFLMSLDSTLERWGLVRELLRSARSAARLPDDASEETRRWLGVFDEYEQLGDRDPFLLWIRSDYQPPSPNPYELEEATQSRIADLAEAIEKGQFAVRVFDPLDVMQLYDGSQLKYYDLLSQPDGLAATDFRYQIVLGLYTKFRDYLAEAHGTPKWDRLRTELSVVASSIAMATDPDLRRWDAHWKDALANFDHYYRGSHPVLTALLRYQVTLLHQARMRYLAQQAGQRKTAAQEDA
jgi:hypothetical protein